MVFVEFIGFFNWLVFDGVVVGSFEEWVVVLGILVEFFED